MVESLPSNVAGARTAKQSDTLSSKGRIYQCLGWSIFESVCDLFWKEGQSFRVKEHHQIAWLDAATAATSSAHIAGLKTLFRCTSSVLVRHHLVSSSDRGLKSPAQHIIFDRQQKTGDLDMLIYLWYYCSSLLVPGPRSTFDGVVFVPPEA